MIKLTKKARQIIKNKKCQVKIIGLKKNKIYDKKCRDAVDGDCAFVAFIDKYYKKSIIRKKDIFDARKKVCNYMIDKWTNKKFAATLIQTHIDSDREETIDPAWHPITDRATYIQSMIATSGVTYYELDALANIYNVVILNIVIHDRQITKECHCPGGIIYDLEKDVVDYKLHRPIKDSSNCIICVSLINNGHMCSLEYSDNIKIKVNEKNHTLEINLI